MTRVIRPGHYVRKQATTTTTTLIQPTRPGRRREGDNFSSFVVFVFHFLGLLLRFFSLSLFFVNFLIAKKEHASG